ncbi:hypothetical protein NDU88_004350 [Pleurodeles waltl]|uniref:Uncharacterized protein n=1 Tax=Pleurodeles waltl TaxID=8319 RepID=A0AAV7TSD9_PLEWA|nr:hypothetical protein NDU88_004350 [Pleurodeles waltl]
MRWRSSVSYPRAATRVPQGHSGEVRLTQKFPSGADGTEAEGRTWSSRRRMWRSRRRTQGQRRQRSRDRRKKTPQERAPEPETTTISPVTFQEERGLTRYMARAGTGGLTEQEKREGRGKESPQKREAA